MTMQMNQANRDVDRLKDGWARFKRLCLGATSKMDELHAIVSEILADDDRKTAAIDLLEASGITIQDVQAALASGDRIKAAIEQEFTPAEDTE